MSASSALAILRDVAGFAAFGLLALTTAAALASGAGLTASLGGLAASVATIAASGLLTLALFGGVSALVDAPLWTLLAAIATVAVVGGFAAAQLFGVRGLWLTLLVIIGALAAAVLLWTFLRHTGRALGPLWPLASATLLALILFGALGAALRGLASPAVASGAPAESPWRVARDAFATPPHWFDCAYATFGGEAVRPGFCAFRPPTVDLAEPGAELLGGGAPPSPGERSARAPGAPTTPLDPALAAEAAQPDREGDTVPSPVPELAAAGPATVAAPAPPPSETPDFAPLRRGEDTPPDAPDRLESARETDLPAPATGGGDTAGAEESAAPPPTLGPAPAPTTASEPASETPDPLGRPDRARVRVAAADRAPTPPTADPAPNTTDRAGPERRRTEFVCFPFPGGLADQLCPDDRLNPRDLSVRWLGSGGEATAAVEQVECFRTPELSLHATLVADLSGALVGSIPQTAGGSSRTRKIDAIYEMFTRLIVGARAASEGGDADAPALHLSAYVAGGSRLLSPWASQQFGAERVDRVFDVRSPRQTLALVRRLQSEAQSLRSATAGRDLVDTLAAVIVERPDPAGVVSHGLTVLAADASATRTLEPGRLEALAERFQVAEVALYVVELGSDAPDERLRAMAERTGGGAFAAASAAELAETVERLLLRTRAYCAVRVSAPESFFDEQGVEVRLRRELLDGCRYEQVATISCQGLSMRERLLRPER